MKPSPSNLSQGQFVHLQNEGDDCGGFCRADVELERDDFSTESGPGLPFFISAVITITI